MPPSQPEAEISVSELRTNINSRAPRPPISANMFGPQGAHRGRYGRVGVVLGDRQDWPSGVRDVVGLPSDLTVLDHLHDGPANLDRLHED